MNVRKIFSIFLIAAVGAVVGVYAFVLVVKPNAKLVTVEKAVVPAVRCASLGNSAPPVVPDLTVAAEKSVEAVVHVMRGRGGGGARWTVGRRGSGPRPHIRSNASLGRSQKYPGTTKPPADGGKGPETHGRVWGCGVGARAWGVEGGGRSGDAPVRGVEGAATSKARTSWASFIGKVLSKAPLI